MENEVSGIAKLGIVLIALAVLIGLGFGIFQISKSTANTGVGNVQAELDSVSQSTFTTYDQTTITGTMASSAVSDFEGDSVAVLIATQAWTNFMYDATTGSGTGDTTVDEDDWDDLGSGFTSAYTENGNSVPVVNAFTSKEHTNMVRTTTSSGKDVGLNFINYNAILGSGSEDAAGVNANWQATFKSYIDEGNATGEYYMANIYFDSNCYRCTSGFATTSGGKVVFNNVASNLSRTGRTEFIPSGAKFNSFLIKDASGTPMGVAFQQVSGN